MTQVLISVGHLLHQAKQLIKKHRGKGKRSTVLLVLDNEVVNALALLDAYRI